MRSGQSPSDMKRIPIRSDEPRPGLLQAQAFEESLGPTTKYPVWSTTGREPAAAASFPRLKRGTNRRKRRLALETRNKSIVEVVVRLVFSVLRLV